MPYDETLFAGTAAWYAQYRPPYPDELIDDIVAHFALDGTGALLDLGCGPGTVTLPLAPYFSRVVAADPDASMVEALREAAAGDGRIEAMVMHAEDVSPALGSFRLVTCGSSFHWMQYEVALARMREVLAPGGGVALLGGLHAWWEGDLDWQRAVTRVIKRYLGAERRTGKTSVAKATFDRFEVILPRHGWKVELERGYDQRIEWTADSIVGYLWSTSFANRGLFGERVDEFESELRAELAALGETFVEMGSFGVVCARP
ncbi:MAG: class I SAM-dependent methyltransferase [Chloroflexota bacterium]